MREAVNWEKLFIGLLVRGPLPECLINLSQEVRDGIYGEVFAAGHIALPRVSKAIYENTKEALAKHGVYRARITQDKLNRWRRDRRPPFHWQYLDEHPSIRNIEISVTTFRSHKWVGTSEMIPGMAPRSGANLLGCSELPYILPGLLDSMREHVHCQVNLETPKYRSINTGDVEGLGVLRTFKEATIKLCYYSGAWPETYIFADGPADPMHLIDADTAITSIFNANLSNMVNKTKLQVVWGRK